MTIDSATLTPEQRQQLIVGWYIRTDVELHCSPVHLDAEGDGLGYGRWWDTRPMLDPHEHSPELIDMAQVALDHGLHIGALQQHPARPYLVRIAAAN